MSESSLDSSKVWYMACIECKDGVIDISEMRLWLCSIDCGGVAGEATPLLLLWLTLFLLFLFLLWLALADGATADDDEVAEVMGLVKILLLSTAAARGESTPLPMPGMLNAAALPVGTERADGGCCWLLLALLLLWLL